MKIMQINCVYGYGSTGKIVADIHTELIEKGYQSVVCYGRRNMPRQEQVYKVSTELEGKVHSVLSRLFGVDFGYSFFSTGRLLRIIAKEKPDVVHLHCLNGHFVNVYRLVEHLKKNRITTVLTLHAEIMHTAGCEHAMDCLKWQTECHDCPRIRGMVSHYFRDDAKHCFRKMKQAFWGFENLTVIGVSDWLTQRAKQSPIISGCHFTTIHNGINTAVFSPQDGTQLRKSMGIPEDKKIVLHVTPNFNHPIKGGNYVIEVARQLPDMQFVIVGFNGDAQALPKNVMTVSHTRDQSELAKYYSMADCMICTSLRESLPTVCLEAVSCGCKVVGFRTGGVPETIPQGMGEVVECYDVAAFVQAVEKWVDVPVNRELVREVNHENDRKRMLERYINIYNR